MQWGFDQLTWESCHLRRGFLVGWRHDRGPCNVFEGDPYSIDQYRLHVDMFEDDDNEPSGEGHVTCEAFERLDICVC